MTLESGPLDIFVSYRRMDSAGHAGRLQEALDRHFGEDHVFFDITDIEGGIDFAAAIAEAIGKSEVVAVIIGPNWARRPFLDRLLSRSDWVLFEIGQARRAGKPVVPILVGGASMPRNLPPEARFLTTINAIAIRDASWHDDVARLIERLPALARKPGPVSPAAPIPATSNRRIIITTGLALILAVLAGLLAMQWRREDPPAQNAGPAPIVTTSVPPDRPPATGAERPAPPVTGQPTTAPSAASTPAAPPPAINRKNRPPTTGSIEVDQFNAIGLLSATKFGMKAKGITDPDGDTLRYRWDFGDGSASPPSSPAVSKVYDRVNRFEVKLYVTDGRAEDEILAAETHVTVRDVTGTWILNLRPDPKETYVIPASYEIVLNQQGNQLSGRITPTGSNRSTVLTGSVEHPTRVQFGSESAWWNDRSDAYFDLYVSDGALMIQMEPFRKDRCGPQIPCLGALMKKQQ